MDKIPEKERKEWQDLLTGQINVELENFVLQMQIDQTKRAIKNAKITLEDGITKIHSLCEKYSLAVKADIKKIFNHIEVE